MSAVRGWRVFACGVPVGAEVVTRVGDDLLEALLADRRVVGPVVSGQAGRLGATVAVDAPSLAEAIGIAFEALGDAFERLGLPREVEVVEAEPEDEPEEETPVLLGASDVARLLGVSRQRVYQLLGEREDFPRPKVRLSRGSLWRRDEVEAWAGARRQRA